MDLVLTEEQALLRQSAKEMVASRSPVARVRRGDDPRALFREMAELGWLGLVVDEAHGGSGLGHRYMMVVLERLGANLVPEPVVSTAVVAATALSLGGTDAAKAAHLPPLVRGERIFAFAHQEASGRFQIAAIDTTAEPDAGGFVLRGEKVHVADGTVADFFLVSARAPDGLALFVVPAASVAVTPQRRIDGRSAAIVRLEGVRVSADARIGTVERGQRLLERVVDSGTAALTAEMLGAMTAAFAMTLDHLKTRVQFNVPIGSFQALQHRAARMYVETEMARSAVMNACAALDAQEPSTAVARAVSVAKAKCSEAFLQIAYEGVQLHGGIGMTEEHDIGLYLKRARVCEMTFGDAAYHRDRFARLAGF